MSNHLSPHVTSFPAIKDYAFLSDCEANLLLSPSGEVEWFCLPRPDSPAVFLSMLDRRAGRFRFGPGDVRSPIARRYLPGTLVLETTWQTRDGWLLVRDALLVGPWPDGGKRSLTWRRAPTDEAAEHVYLRTAECLAGEVSLVLDCEPAPTYGTGTCRWDYAEGDYRSVQAQLEPELSLSLSGALRLGIEGSRVRARTTLSEGQATYVALSWGDGAAPSTWPEAASRMEQTMSYWRRWLDDGYFPDHPWRERLQRSALTLKGLSFAPTGAFISASTTSLPETPGGSRNWDYRYAWLRDSTFALWGLYTLGLNREADDFFFFLMDVCRDGQELQVVYAVDGGHDLSEVELPHLSGYKGAKPVRVGNDAFKQKQNDVWGVVVDSVYIHERSSAAQLPEPLWSVVREQVDAALRHWRDKDRGIWEVRGAPQHFTTSKLMCWVATDRGARLARARGEELLADRWQLAADEIHADICANALRDGVFVQHYGSQELDASLLLMPLFRFLPPTDQRIIDTVTAIEERLTVNGLVLRYRTGVIDDGLRGDEGTFAICSFWLVSALATIGEVARAKVLADRLLSMSSELGLYAEELDARSGEHLGNYPQAFTHLALINALVHLIRAEEGVPADRLSVARMEREG